VTHKYSRKRWLLGQPTGSTCSSRTIGVDCMLLGRNIGRRMSGTVWIATVSALLVLSTLLVAQNVPLEFPQAASGRQCLMSAGSTHCQTQRFYSDGVQWTAPVEAFVILPSARSGSGSWKRTQQFFPAIQTKGFRFNRPPPSY
jgi:hypothetical protein